MAATVCVRNRRSASTIATALMTTWASTKTCGRSNASRAPATSGPTALIPVRSAASAPSVVPTRPGGATAAVSGLRIGANIVSPTAKIAKATTNIALATCGDMNSATSSSSQLPTQIAPTTISRPAPRGRR